MDRKETANTRNKLVEEVLLQKERTSEIASFLLLIIQNMESSINAAWRAKGIAYQDGGWWYIQINI